MRGLEPAFGAIAGQLVGSQAPVKHVQCSQSGEKQGGILEFRRRVISLEAPFGGAVFLPAHVMALRLQFFGVDVAVFVFPEMLDQFPCQRKAVRGGHIGKKSELHWGRQRRGEMILLQARAKSSNELGKMSDSLLKVELHLR